MTNQEIATKVVGELTSTLLGGNSNALVNLGTSNTQAYETYLRGRYLIFRDSDDPQAQNEADQLFQRAIDLDPDFALAWYGQFFVMSFRQRGGQIGYHEGATQLRLLADKLVSMDPELAESQIAYGRSATVDLRWIDAETAYRKAIQLNPGGIGALQSLGELLSVLDRPEEGLEYALEALLRDPLDLRALGAVTAVYSWLGQCEKAEDITKRALSLSAGASRFNGRVGQCLSLFTNDSARSIEWFEKESLGFMKNTGLAIAYHQLGDQEKAQHYLEALIEADGDAAAYQYAQIFAQWGETEKALDALEKAWEIGDAGFVLMKRDKHLVPLRQEPRYLALLEIWKGATDR